MTPDDTEFSAKTKELQEYLRKKTIHANIFKTIDASAASEKAGMVYKRKEANPLASGLVTCDTEGRPLKIEPITKFSKNLTYGAHGEVSDEPAKVIRDPDEIALALG